MDKTLLKGLAMLELMANNEGTPATIQQLATQLGLTKSNAHRTLQTLAHAGYVTTADGTGAYRSTMKLFELGARQLARLDIRKFALSSMRQLADFTTETVHLSILEGFDVIYIEKIDSPQPIRAYSVVGGRAPAYCVATGKALLAFQPDWYLDKYAGDLPRHSPATITTLPVLKEELARVARIGYAVNRGEWRESVGGLAAPIFNGLDQVVAAIGISGPLERLNPNRMQELAPATMKAAAEISRAMGYRRGYFGESV
jgi:IclR family KDG regulon transcriptional repressor